MQKRTKGNPNMPDFQQLNDRIIAEPTDAPTLVIKTNLDPKNVKENNPYYQNSSKTDDETFRQYFEEK